MTAPRLIDDDVALARVLPEVAAAETLALDCEGNGLFAYRARLCCTQLAWFDGGELQVVVIDPFAVELAPLGPILGPEGPRKVLHDLTFDARMLQDAGLELGHVWDTSVAARFLGEEATGLASLAKAHLGVELDKGLQHHDWSQRPLRERELAYLAGDVRHLLELAEVLERLVMEHGIVEEVRLEVEYKLGTGLAPPKATRPAHERIKGYRKLSPVERSILKSLCETRDELAAEVDRPAFKIASDGALLQVAKIKPRSGKTLRRVGHKSLLRRPSPWLSAVTRGIEAGGLALDEPDPETLLSREEVKLRHALEDRLSSWRRAEAKARGVDLQVILPGHCTGPLTSTLLDDEAGSATPLSTRLAAIPGLGETRIVRYAAAWSALAEDARASQAE